MCDRDVFQNTHRNTPVKVFKASGVFLSSSPTGAVSIDGALMRARMVQSPLDMMGDLKWGSKP